MRHTGAAADAHLTLVVEGGPDCLRIEVHDQGGGFAAPDDPWPRREGTSGWGLHLVKKLARRWGAQPSPDPHVWFELARA